MNYTPSIVVEGWALDAAIRQWWSTHPEIEGDPLGSLPQYDRNRIVNLAIQIESEAECN